MLHQRFRVRPPGLETPDMDLVLVEVSGNSQGALETFSLLFRGPLEGVFPHDTYAVGHPTLGDMELFLGPVNSVKTDGVYYQAVFTKIKA
jgi:hypothetical protein